MRQIPTTYIYINIKAYANVLVHIYIMCLYIHVYDIYAHVYREMRVYIDVCPTCIYIYTHMSMYTYSCETNVYAYIQVYIYLHLHLNRVAFVYLYIYIYRAAACFHFTFGSPICIYSTPPVNLQRFIAVSRVFRSLCAIVSCATTAAVPTS